VTRHKQWRRVARKPSPLRPPRHPVPADLVGLCFNCFRPDHVAGVCPNFACCLRCHGEGHQVRSCKRSQWPDSVGPPPQQQKPFPSIILNPATRDVTLAALAPRRSPARKVPVAPRCPPSGSPPGSSMPSDMNQDPTPEGSPSRHILPSPPPPHPVPLGASSCRPRF
jgi:hypothetical protein